MHQETHVHSNPTQKAKVFCVKADENGYATIHEGAVWLSSSRAMVELQKEHADNPDSPYKTYLNSTHKCNAHPCIHFVRCLPAQAFAWA